MPHVALAAELPKLAVDPLGASLSQTLAGLAAVLVVIGVLAWLARRFPKLRGGDGPIKVIAGLSLGARERLVLIEVEGARLLVGVAPGRVQTLHVLAQSAAKDGFSEVLELARRGGSHG
ncbi:MAG: flagellar biosynthetic protein FliO [Gammaproteobacteria bacterium]